MYGWGRVSVLQAKSTNPNSNQIKQNWTKLILMNSTQPSRARFITNREQVKNGTKNGFELNLPGSEAGCAVPNILQMYFSLLPPLYANIIFFTFQQLEVGWAGADVFNTPSTDLASYYWKSTKLSVMVVGMGGRAGPTRSGPMGGPAAGRGPIRGRVRPGIEDHWGD